MNLKFHWQSDEDGVIVHELGSVSVNLLNEEGEIRSGDPQLTLEGEYQPCLPLWPWRQTSRQAFAGTFDNAGRAALRLEGLAPPRADPGCIQWRLLSGGLPAQRGKSLWVSERALLLRRAALSASVACLVVLGLLLPNLRGYLDDFGGIIAFFAGGVGVAVSAPSRAWAWRKLLHREVALTVLGLSIAGLFTVCLGFRKIYNLSLDTCTFGRLVIPPRSVAMVWRPGTSATCDGERRSLEREETAVGPFKVSDAEGLVAWVPWLTSQKIECSRPVPPLFHSAWLESGKCSPAQLRRQISISKCASENSCPRGSATLVHSDSERAFDKAACKQAEDGLPAECLGDKYLTLTLEQLRGIELRARGVHAITEVTYERLQQEQAQLLLPLEATDLSGGFEFYLAGQRQGVVALQRGTGSSSSGGAALTCRKLASALGIESVLLASESVSTFTKTSISDPWGSVSVPVCFDGARRPEEGVVSFAEGWSPRTAHALDWPCGMLPAKLNLRSHEGEWLGTVQLSSEPRDPSALCKLTVHAVAWHTASADVLSYRASPYAPAKDTVQVPASAGEAGAIAWKLHDNYWRKPTEPSPPKPADRVKVEGSAKDSLVFQSNDVRVETEALPDYYFENGEFQRAVCALGKPTAAGQFILNLAVGRGLRYRHLYDCPRAG